MKFYYGTKVEVVSGFYMGLQGHIIKLTKYEGRDSYTLDVIETTIDGKTLNPQSIGVLGDDLELVK